MGRIDCDTSSERYRQFCRLDSQSRIIRRRRDNLRQRIDTFDAQCGAAARGSQATQAQPYKLSETLGRTDKHVAGDFACGSHVNKSCGKLLPHNAGLPYINVGLDPLSHLPMLHQLHHVTTRQISLTCAELHTDERQIDSWQADRALSSRTSSSDGPQDPASIYTLHPLLQANE